MSKGGMTVRKNINVLLALALAFVCLLVQSAYAATAGQTGTIQYEGKKVQISIGEIGKNDKGQTTVEICTNFEVIIPDFSVDFAFKAITKVIQAKIVAKNKTFEASTLSTGEGKFRMSVVGNGKWLAKFEHIIYAFDTTVSPEKIMVYNEQGASLAFSGKTRKIIK
jgi:predicted RNA-binding protein with TRAM domain